MYKNYTKILCMPSGSIAKLLLIMRLTTVILITTLLQVSASSFGQRMTLERKSITLQRIFKEIRKQTGYDVLLSTNRIGINSTIDVSFSNAALDEVMEKVIQGRGLTYTIEDKTILIKQNASLMDKLMFVFNAIDVRGRITDDNGKALPGASVHVKGTKTTAVANNNGEFFLKGIEDNAVLSVSYLGFITNEIRVDRQTVINIVLKEDQTGLNEVVVVGFGTQKKSNLTGSVSTISARDLVGRPITSVSSGLQGLLPGLTAVGQSGMPGASGAMLRIRGLTSLNNSEPFILVDGIPQDLNSINPEDIESVSLLKDAASTSIYGTRAANGVILITTKSGSLNQKISISYNGYYGIQKPTALPKMLGSAAYMELLNEAQSNSGIPPSFTQSQIETARNGSDPNYFANTNWFNEIYKNNAPQQNHAVSFTGGSSDLKYYMSYGRQDQQGLAVGDQFGTVRNNARIRLNAAKILDILDIDANLGYIDRDVNQSSAATSQNGGVFYTGLTISPLSPVKFTNGLWGYGGGSSNPVAIATDGGFDLAKTQQFTGSIAATLHLMKDLELQAQYGLDMHNQNRNIFSRRIDYLYPETGAIWYTSNPNNTLDERQYINKIQTFAAQVNYRLNLNAHHLKALAGTQLEWRRNDYWRAVKTNFLSDNVPVLNLGTANPTNYGDAFQYALRGYFGRINYDFADKYLFEANLRYDGTSTYAPESRYGLFPSASAGWRFTQENFIKNSIALAWLSEGKIRMSYGLLGNQYNADASGYGEYYPYIPSIISVSTMPIGNVLTQGFAQTVLANTALEWEKVRMFNIAVDLALFKNRLTFTAEWYNRETRDIQLKVAQPAVIGVSVSDQNAGSVSNKGWELNLGWNDQIKEFRYGFSAQLSDVKNKVISLGGVAPTIANNIRLVGYPINAYYGYKTAGLAQAADFTKDEVTGKLSPNFPIFPVDAGKVAPGDLKFVDLDGDGIISADKDRTVIGDPFPHYTYSFRGNLGFKQFDFSFFLQGVGKANGYISGPAIHPFYADAAFPQEMHLDHWTPDNTTAWYPRLLFKDTRNTTRQLAEYWLQDASYLRLKNIQLGYTIPNKWISKWRVDQFRIFFSADNLFTSTNFFSAYDPETIVPGEASGDKISNGGFYPQVKTIIFGINLRLK
ncbi:TonB-dependent receptor plug [Pedobacter heparinus DSM 2366]|uniref:TonB-dependent receptor plug n=2 Tax=Pedobacter heparinus TaxID=984 RepID=C6XZN8_PEDHD|nr:TonB-dependent receptor plug [Pedobacter heparinus DSM 2366]